MRSLAKPGHLDTAAWRTATRWAPLVVQGVVGLLFLVMWLLGTWPFATHGPGQGERAWLLSATVVTVLLSLAVSAALARSESSPWRGLSLSVAGSALVVLIGGVFFAAVVAR